MRGNLVVGESDNDRAGEVAGGFAVSIIDSGAAMIRMLHEGVQKADIYLQAGRMEFVDPDHSFKTPFVVQFDGTNNVAFGSTTSTGEKYGNGAGVVSIHNATQAPNQNPPNGGVLYAQDGALKWRGSSGTVTTIAPA